MNTLSLVVVSHGQSDLVKSMLVSFQDHLPDISVEIVLVENLKKEILDKVHDCRLSLHQIINPKPYGLAKNINSAVKHTQGKYLCIVNPDVLFVEDCLSKLISRMETNKIDIIAPLVFNSDGEVQDSFRSIPTFWELICRYLGKRPQVIIPERETLLFPEWIASIFLLMYSETFYSLCGFDERYKLYFEDVDFCLRAAQAGFNIAVDSQTHIIHNAQRMSRKILKYLIWHVQSGLKFFVSPTYRKYIEKGK